MEVQVQVQVQVQVEVEVAAQGSKTAALPVQISPQRIVIPPKVGGWTSGLGALQYDPQSTAARKHLGAQRENVYLNLLCAKIEIK